MRKKRLPIAAPSNLLSNGHGKVISLAYSMTKGVKMVEMSIFVELGVGQFIEMKVRAKILQSIKS